MKDCTIQRAAQLALDVQSAANLSGITLSLADLLVGPIREEMDRTQRGTNFRNRHPIVVAWIDKMASLSRCYDQDFRAGYHAMDACEAIAAASDFAEIDRIYTVWFSLLDDTTKWDGPRFRDALTAHKETCK